MSRDPRVFEEIEKLAYDQNKDRIIVLSAALRGVSRLMSEYLWINNLSSEENEMIRAEIIRSLVDNHLNNLSDEQILGALDQIEVELESNDEEKQ